MGAFKASSAPAARRATVVVRAQSNTDFVKEMGKNAAVLAAGLVLTMVSEQDRWVTYLQKSVLIKRIVLHDLCKL